MGNPVTITVGLVAGGVRTGLNAIRNQFRQLRGFINSEIGSAISFGAILAGFQQVIQKAGQLTDISQQFGASTKFLQQVGNVAEQNGASLEGLAKSLNKVSVNQEKVRAGNKEATESLNALGVSTAQFVNASPEEAWMLISDAVAKSDDKTKAYNATVQLMGRGAGELFSTLSMGSEAIKSMGDAVGIMTDEQVALLDEAGDSLTNLKNQLLVWGADIVSFGVKAVQTFAGILTSVIAGVMDTWEGLKKAGQGILEMDMSKFQKGASETVDGLMGQGEQGQRQQKVVREELDKIWDKPEAKPSRARNVDIEEAEAEVTAREKLAEMEKKIADKRADFARDQLTDQEKILALEEERVKLEMLGSMESRNKEKLEIEEQRLSIEKEIAETRKKIDADAERKAEDIASLNKQLSDAQFARDMDLIESRADKLKVMQEKVKQLNAEIASAQESGDEKRQTELMIEREKMLAQTDQLSKAPKMEVVASSLARIGGGGRAFIGPREDDSKRTAKASETTAKNTAEAVKVLGEVKDKIDSPKWQ
jgi:hypothetical protein